MKYQNHPRIGPMYKILAVQPLHQAVNTNSAKAINTDCDSGQHRGLSPESWSCAQAEFSESSVVPLVGAFWKYGVPCSCEHF